MLFDPNHSIADPVYTILRVLLLFWLSRKTYILLYPNRHANAFRKDSRGKVMVPIFQGVHVSKCNIVNHFGGSDKYTVASTLQYTCTLALYQRTKIRRIYYTLGYKYDTHFT